MGRGYPMEPVEPAGEEPAGRSGRGDLDAVADRVPHVVECLDM
jgi:hypothetical protein